MTQDEWNNAEHFIEGYMLVLTYDIITKRVNLKDLINSDEEIILSYDPFLIGETDQSWLVQDLIDWYVEQEEYEKCAKLLKMKIRIDKGLLDLSSIIYLKEKDFQEAEADLAVKALIKEVLGNNYNKN